MNEQVQQAQRIAEQAQEFRAKADAVRGQEKSRDGYVTATVDTSGRLLDLVLSDRITDVSPRELAKLIVHTTHGAHARAGAQAIELANETFGEDSAVSAHLQEEVARTVIDDGDGVTWE